MTRRLAMALTVLAVTCPAFAQFDFTAKVSKDLVVRLEPAKGTPTDVTPTEIKKTKEVTIPFNVKRTGFFDLPAAVLQVDPVKIHFGTRDPEKGWGLRLVRLTPKEGKVEVTMKMGALSMSTTKESQPYLEDIKMPEAVKGTDGRFTLTLPKPLAPGIYAVIGFNGASGPGGLFSTKDGVAWVFEVGAPKAAVPVPPASAPAAPSAPAVAPAPVAPSAPAAAPATSNP